MKKPTWKRATTFLKKSFVHSVGEQPASAPRRKKYSPAGKGRAQIRIVQWETNSWVMPRLANRGLG